MPDSLTPSDFSTVSEFEQGFDLRQAVSFAWREWKFIALVTAVTLVFGAVYLLGQTPLYTATGQVLLEQQHQRMPGGDALRSDQNMYDIAMVENQMAIIRSTVLLRRVVERERLAPTPAASPPNGGEAAE